MKKDFSHIKTLFYRLLFVLGLFELCRILFILFNLRFFENTGWMALLSTLRYGLLFDTSVIIYLNIVFILTSILPFRFREKNSTETILKYVFIISNSVAIFLNIIDFEFFKFTNKRSGIELFKERSDVKNILSDYIYDYWYLLLIFAVFIVSIVFFYKKTRLRHKPDYSLRSYIVQSLIAVLSFGLIILGGRGGLNVKPIRPFDASRYVVPELMPVVLNTPFTMMFTAQNYSLQKHVYMDDSLAARICNPHHTSIVKSSFKKENIVVIILESFGKEYTGFFNNGKGYTPFFDSLCRNGLVFMNGYADGKSSNTGIPAIIAGMPTWMDVPYLNTNYQSNRINSIGELLKAKGYYTAFFHGGRNGTIALDNFVAMSETGDYYGMDQYPDKSDFDGSWGIYDEPFLQFFEKTLSIKPQPFYAAIFTLSSHHPYKLPDKYKNKFRGGSLPIHKSIEYADFALRNFFKSASKEKWFKNTLFVLTADHSAVNTLPFYQTIAGRYSIPLVFYKGDGSLKGKAFGTVQQIDIMPGILGYLNYDRPYFAFGKNILDTNFSPGAIEYDNGLWQYIKLPYILHFDGKKCVGFYDYSKDPLMKDNLMGAGIPEMLLMKNYLQALIQVYDISLINNKTYIDPAKGLRNH